MAIIAAVCFLFALIDFEIGKLTVEKWRDAGFLFIALHLVIAIIPSIKTLSRSKA